MSCDNGTCGTGDYSGPKPGDPSNSVSLSANVVFGGINVSWSYPTLNPHAVAHTILYRGITPEFTSAIKLVIVAGSLFYDQIDADTPVTYYYWIEIVSVNGTVGATIGPASTTSKPRVLATLESLSGRIDDSVLATALRTSIGGITLVDGRVSTEIQNRINSNVALAAALASAQSGAVEAMTFVQDEITARTEGDSALLGTLSTLSTAVGSNFSLFQNEKILRTSKDTAYASDFSLLYAKAGQTASAITTETQARVSGDGALASRVTTAEVALNGNVATGQIGLTTQVSTVNGKVTEIGALYTAKLSVNGLIGGFGVYNNGQYIDAGFDVDTFWIGRTQVGKVKPFIVDGTTVYIDKARIRNADIDTLKIAGNSIIVGVYDQGYGASVPSNGSTNLIIRTLDLGDGSNSGVIATATVSCSSTTNVTVGFKVIINGITAGDCRASMLGGYGYLFPVSGFAPASGSRYVTVILQAYNPDTGAGSNTPFTVTGCTMSIMGGKR